MDSKNASCYFIRYPKRSQRFRFYCPSHTIRIVETRTARFIKDGKNSGSGELRNAILQKIRESLSITVIPKDFSHEPIQHEIVKRQW